MSGEERGAGRLLPSRLYAIADADVAARAGWVLPDLADAYLQAGARFLQVRAKDAPSADLLRWIDDLAAHATPDTWIIVNDRVDVALAAGVRRVHLGQDDLPAIDARRLLGPSGVIGLSTHTDRQVDDACGLPIDYIAVGPVFGTRTKATGYAPVGTALVRAAREAVTAREGPPIVAIGGVTLERAAEVIDAGADAVVVISDLLAGGSPTARVRAFLRELGEA